MRGASSPCSDKFSSVTKRPCLERAGPAASPISCTMLFHSWQESQRPCQRLVIAPQFWQTKIDRALAILFLKSGEACGAPPAAPRPHLFLRPLDDH